MKDLSECYEIARLISARISETITPEESEKLDAWLAEDERHRKRFCRIQEQLKKEEKNNIFRKPEEVLKDLEKVKEKLLVGKSVSLKRYYFFYYAAAVIFIVGMAVSLLWWQPGEKQRTEIPQLAKQEPILSGLPKAILTLANGEQVNLEKMEKSSLRKDGMLIHKGEGELTYEQGTERLQQVVFNKVTIPRSGEYKLTLADGTRVWLNSATELRYPVTFMGDNRRVFLKGEAYFEVAADAEHPFIVETANVNVEVLGTGFNVMAYSEEAEAAVTLAHGKVGVQTAKQQIVLKPEEQYVYRTSTGIGTVRKVEVAYYTSWKEGILNFDAMPLDELTVKLSRWYDVNFFFTSEKLKQLKFSGAFKKDDQIRYVLDIIEEITDVKFMVNGRTVIVK